MTLIGVRVAVAAMLIAVTGAVTGVVPGAEHPPVRSVPPSIDATGTVDVTAALNRFLAALPDGVTVRFREEGRYRIEGTVRLVAHHDVVLDGQGAMLFATTEGAQDRSHLSVEDSSGVVVRDVVIKGTNPNAGVSVPAYRPDKAFQHGIRILSSRDVEVDHVRVSDVFGDLVSVNHGPSREWCENVWIHDSVLTRNGRQGIAVTAARHVVIERNDISATRRATIDLEPDTSAFGVEDVHIIDNRIGPGLLRFVAAHGGGPVEQVVIARNQLWGRDLAIDVKPPAGTRRRGYYIIDNTSEVRAGSTPLRLTGLDGVLVRGNTQPMRTAKPAILATDVCGLRLERNTFPGAVAVMRAVGPTCDQPAPGPVPEPPVLIGRPTAGAPTSTSSTSGPAAVRPGPEPARASGGGIDAGTWGLVLAVVAGVGLAALALDQVRRAHRGVAAPPQAGVSPDPEGLAAEGGAPEGGDQV